ncbi:hypothetical protein L0F63_005381 [Massospora cicadina]|nr:hypothetical protein L0F63_005381 [Massospora cicadina]
MVRLTANPEPSSPFDASFNSHAKPSRLSRCLCCSSPLGAVLGAIFSLVLLAACGVLALLLIPRVPSIQFRDLTYSDGSPLNELSTLDPTPDGALVIPLLINFDVSSENYVDIKINRVDLVGTMGDVPVGRGSLSSPLTIVRRATTLIALPFALDYDLKDLTKSNLNVIKQLNASCSADPAKRKALNIDYEADLAVEVLGWSHVIPHLRNAFTA